MAMSSDVQKLKGLSIGDNQMKETQSKIQITSERYPDLILPVVENHRVSDCFVDTQTACLQITIPWL